MPDGRASWAIAADEVTEAVEAATTVIRLKREPLLSVRFATKRTGSVYYLSQNNTVAVNALCDSLRRAHAVATETVL